jgi:hypothetical protein
MRRLSPMREKKDLPDDAQISALLRHARVSPALPPRFQQNVWRRIENAGAKANSASWLDALAGLILRPRFAITAAVLLLLAGISVGTLEGWQAAQRDAQLNYLASVAPHVIR